MIPNRATHQTSAGSIVAKRDNTTWSLYGAAWSQPVAISGKSARRRSGENKPKPLPWVATDCRRVRMVRRGSTVRVRQRALQIAANRPVFGFWFCSQIDLQSVPCGGDGELHRPLMSGGAVAAAGAGRCVRTARDGLRAQFGMAGLVAADLAQPDHRRCGRPWRRLPRDPPRSDCGRAGPTRPR